MARVKKATQKTKSSPRLGAKKEKVKVEPERKIEPKSKVPRNRPRLRSSKTVFKYSNEWEGAREVDEIEFHAALAGVSVEQLYQQQEQLKAEKKKVPKAPRVKTGKPQPVYFCDPDSREEGGFLSPYWRSPFKVNGTGKEYEMAAQYIFAEKARVFGDMNARRAVLRAWTVAEVKKAGQRIKGVDKESWRRLSLEIAETANIHKFSPHHAEGRALLRSFLKLKRRLLVYADPSDSVLGIRFDAESAKVVGRDQWGANVFGKSLNAVRRHPDVVKAQDTGAAFLRDDYFDTSVFDAGGRYAVNW